MAPFATAISAQQLSEEEGITHNAAQVELLGEVQVSQMLCGLLSFFSWVGGLGYPGEKLLCPPAEHNRQDRRRMQRQLRKAQGVAAKKRRIALQRAYRRGKVQGVAPTHPGAGLPPFLED